MYFEKFPNITYRGANVKNILARVKLSAPVVGDPRAYYPYQTQYGERPEIVAFNYYDDCNYMWLVAFANDIIDPYHDWYIEPSTLDSLVTKAYSSVAEATSTITGYRSRYNLEETIPATQYESLTPGVQRYWTYNDDNSYKLNDNRLYANTNNILRIYVNSTTPFAVGDRVTSGNARGTVTSVNTTNITVQHTSGSFVAGAISTTKGSTTSTSIETVANVIPLDEQVYWEEMNLYQQTVEANDDKQTIKLLSNIYTTEADTQLKTLMKS